MFQLWAQNYRYSSKSGSYTLLNAKGFAHSLLRLKSNQVKKTYIEIKSSLAIKTSRLISCTSVDKEKLNCPVSPSIKCVPNRGNKSRRMEMKERRKNFFLDSAKINYTFQLLQSFRNWKNIYTYSSIKKTFFPWLDFCVLIKL